MNSNMTAQPSRSPRKGLMSMTFVLSLATFGSLATAATWKIHGEGLGDADGKSFDLTLDASNGTFAGAGANPDAFFTATKGTFHLGALAEIGTTLFDAKKREVCFF